MSFAILHKCMLCNVLARIVILQGQLAGIEQKHLLVQLRTFSMFDK